MKKTLILAEKPSVAREIARVLGCRKPARGSIEGDRYVVTWALGHLVELKMPEDYNDNYRTWRLEDLPIIPAKMETKPIKQTRSQFNIIRRLADRSDIGELVIATDAGREGELVARWILKQIGWQKPLKRLWISSQTDRAIRDGFNHLKNASEFDRLYQSAVCRSEADWLIGLNLSRALTAKYNDSLSAGRVQTPTLAMILSRQKQITAFKPEPFWTIETEAGPWTLKWQKGNMQRLTSLEQAERIQNKLQHAEASVTEVSIRQKKFGQPLLYDLTELQRDANRRYGFSAKKTLNILQTLYERYKIVTYPRTDSHYLSQDIESTMTERLEAAAPLFGPIIRRILHRQKGRVLAQQIFNDSKVTDHHALIPTEEPVPLSKLSADEQTIYELIVRRFLTLFYPPCLSESLHAIFNAAGEQLTLSQFRQIDPGFRAVLSDEPQLAGEPFSVQQRDRFPIRKARIIEKMTEPPALFSESDLLAQMEQNSLGTVATRADIIEKLVQSELILRVAGGRLKATEKGRQLVDLVHPDFKTPQLTAQWEKELEQIAQGSGRPEQFIDRIKQRTKRLVDQVRESEHSYQIQNLTQSRCPNCGSPMKEIKGRDGGRILICINKDCDYRKRKDPLLSGKHCPHCHKRMELHRGKSGTYFQCRSCGIVEKAEKNRKQAGKQETRRLMNKINGQESSGKSLAEALKSALAKGRRDGG